MGNNEAATPIKAEKAQPTIQCQDQPVVHPYPDWAALQAYYGAGMMPPPYFGPTVAPGHTHPFMWGPQPMIPPFGSPYAAIYPPGVYPHPAMSINSHAHCQGIVPSPATSEAIVMATPLSMEMQTKSSGNKDRGPTKKHKGLDGLAIGNGSTENTGVVDGNGQSQSGYNSAEGSTEGSDGNNAIEGTKGQRKRSSEDVTASGNTLGTALPSCAVPSMDLRIAADNKAKSISAHLSPGGAVVTHRGGSELWMQDERELKRERRKQSNRESARRSRLRKQAETEELAVKVESLITENANIRAEINQLIESSEKLKLENSALMAKLKSPQSMQIEEEPDRVKTDNAPCVVENFLSIIDNPNSSTKNEQQKDESNGKSTTRLHQLLDPSRRTDAVAAS